MSNQNTAIKSELSRVRELKRNAESTITLLRNDMEQGKIHIRVNSDPSFREEVAEAVVNEAHPGYHGQYYTYVDPVEGQVYTKNSQAAWNPWSEAVNWRIVSVDDLVDQSSNDFSPCVDWDIVDFPYRDMAIAYLESEGESLEANGDIPEWVRRTDVVSWAAEDERFSEIIQEQEALALCEAVSFARNEILDEIVIDINE